MRQLIRDSHHNETTKKKLRTQSFQLFRALIERNIIEIMPAGSEQKLRVNVELQDDFSLNQVLSLYCIDTLGLLDTTAPGYELKLLSLVESILENPDIILRKQLDQARNDKFAELKAAGIEYDERMEELEKVEYPKPESEFIYETFNRFAAEHPWVGSENIKPKSIAREMFERYSSFADYVKHYGLMRAEGLLLRHLTNVYRVLEHSIPPAFKTEPVHEVITYIEHLLRITDSSLLDEWNTLKDPDYQPKPLTRCRPPAKRWTSPATTKFSPAWCATKCSAFCACWPTNPTKRFADSFPLEQLFPGAKWAHVELGNAMDAYYASHAWIRLDPAARNTTHTRIIESDDCQSWTIEQTLIDPDELNDTQIVFNLSIPQTRQSKHVQLIPVELKLSPKIRALIPANTSPPAPVISTSFRQLQTHRKIAPVRATQR